MKYNLKDIVPNMEQRLKKLNTLRKVFMALMFFILPAIPAMIILAKYGSCKQWCNIITTIKMYEKIPIHSVLGYFVNANEAAQKLIDTGNLEGYRIAGDAMLVKDGIMMTDEEAQREAAACFNVMAAVNAGMSAENMSEVAKLAVVIQQANLTEQAYTDK